jgi:hypothetical protein
MDLRPKIEFTSVSTDLPDFQLFFNHLYFVSRRHLIHEFDPLDFHEFLDTLTSDKSIHIEETCRRYEKKIYETLMNSALWESEYNKTLDIQLHLALEKETGFCLCKDKSETWMHMWPMEGTDSFVYWGLFRNLYHTAQLVTGTWKDVFTSSSFHDSDAAHTWVPRESSPLSPSSLTAIEDLREKAIAYKHKVKFQMLNNFPKTSFAGRLRDTLRQRIKTVCISRTRGECRYLDKAIL